MKKITMFWRVSGGITVLCMVCITYMLVDSFIEGHKPYERRTEVYSSDCYVTEYSDDTYDVHNAISRKVTIKGIDWLIASDAYRDSLVLFSKRQRRGYFDRYTGEVVIPAQYPHAWIFSEGLSAVVKDDKIGFIDRTGKVVLNFVYTFPKDIDKKADFVFRGGFCNLFNETGRCGIINKKGEWVMAPEYDYICNPLNGKRLFLKEGKYGVWDENLHLIIPPLYKQITLLDDYVIVTLPNDTKQQMTYRGELLNLSVFDGTNRLYYLTGRYNENGEEVSAHADCDAYWVNNKYGLMDLQGKTVTLPLYSQINAIRRQMFECTLSDLCSVVLLNERGEVIE